MSLTYQVTTGHGQLKPSIMGNFAAPGVSLIVVVTRRLRSEPGCECNGDVSLVSEQTLPRTEFGFLGTCVKLWQ